MSDFCEIGDRCGDRLDARQHRIEQAPGCADSAHRAWPDARWARRDRRRPPWRAPPRFPRRIRRSSCPRARSGSGASCAPTPAPLRGPTATACAGRAGPRDLPPASMRLLAALHHRAPGDDGERRCLRAAGSPCRTARRNRRPDRGGAPRRNRAASGARRRLSDRCRARRSRSKPNRILRHSTASPVASRAPCSHCTSFDWLCQGSPHLKKPPGMRTTMGAANRLAVRQRIVPQSLSCSAAGSAYLRNWISGTGISPAAAMPTARPMMPSSDRLVSNTRATPNLLLQAEGRGVHAALAAHIFAENQHPWIDGELVFERAAHRGDQVDARPLRLGLFTAGRGLDAGAAQIPPCSCRSSGPIGASFGKHIALNTLGVRRRAPFDIDQRCARPGRALRKAPDPIRPAKGCAGTSCSRSLVKGSRSFFRGDFLGGLVGLRVLARVTRKTRNQQPDERRPLP